MNIFVAGSTKPGYQMPLDEAIQFSSHQAGICYMKDDIKAIIDEDIKHTLGRAGHCLSGGHHSVFSHVNYTVVFQGIPKIIAMILNNEQMYNASEKSARYTRMDNVPELELELYNKWNLKFRELIADKYPNLPEAHIEKLAMENARYMISVFTPTTLSYTTNLTQWNYILEMVGVLINEIDSGIYTKLSKMFTNRLRPHLVDFYEIMKPFKVEGLERPKKHPRFKMFLHPDDTPVSIYDYPSRFDDSYQVSYHMSFAGIAQAQRHRTLTYNTTMPRDERTGNFVVDDGLYIPMILRSNQNLVDEWREDLFGLQEAYVFPQAQMPGVIERGLYENFVLKCHERICCHAQHEIMMNTKILLERFVSESPINHSSRRDFARVVEAKGLTSKTQLTNIWCAGKCNLFGRRYAISREV